MSFGKGGSGRSDAAKTAAEQIRINRDNALFNRRLSNIDQYTPHGSLVWRQIGEEGGVPKFAAVQEQTPWNRRLTDQQYVARNMLSDALLSMLGGGGSPFAPGGFRPQPAGYTSMLAGYQSPFGSVASGAPAERITSGLYNGGGAGSGYGRGGIYSNYGGPNPGEGPDSIGAGGPTGTGYASFDDFSNIGFGLGIGGDVSTGYDSPQEGGFVGYGDGIGAGSTAADGTGFNDVDSFGFEDPGYGDSGDDGDDGGDDGGVCFLTTAVCEIRGEPDDGPTLTALRKFRDTYMRERHPDKVSQYYEVAPKILAVIPKSASLEWSWIGKKVDEAVDAIKRGKNREAMRVYESMVKTLMLRWGVR